MNRGQDDTKVKELRIWLAKRLGREDVPRPLWEWLENEGYVEDLFDTNQPLDQEDLLGRAKEVLRFAKEMVPFVGASASSFPSPRTPEHEGVVSKRRKVRREPQIYEPLLDPLAEVLEQFIEAGAPVEPHQERVVKELLSRPKAQLKAKVATPPDDPLMQRAKAFSLYLAKLANEDHKVRHFRQEVLADAVVLSEVEAKAFLFSPATALFPSTWFKENDVPFMEHTAEVLELQTISRGWPRRQRGTARVKWDGSEVVVPFEGAVFSDGLARGVVGAEPVSALKGSVISDLWLVDEHLRGRFPWRPLHRDILQVPMFVLTNRTPWVEPFRVTVPAGYPDLYQTVNITAWPWVPVEEVASTYEHVRKELNPTPTTSSKRLTLFIFVMQHPEVQVPRETEKPKVPSWRKLLRLWNERYPEGSKRHYKDVRNFQRDFKEAYDQIVNFYRSAVWWTARQNEPEGSDSNVGVE